MSSGLVATYIGTGKTIQEAVLDAENQFIEANSPLADTIKHIGVSAQTFWIEKEQVYYHIITYGFEI